MRYEAVRAAVFLERPNRFIARVSLDGEPVVCHVKNTGRCRELLVRGATVYLAAAGSAGRKTAWDLIAVEKGPRLINMDAQAPNRVFAEFARRFEPSLLEIHPEVRLGQSRLDFCLALPGGVRHFVEVKGVTLERDGHAFFPDAPTERGVKHLGELSALAAAGHRATAFFVVQMADALDFAPNDLTHPAFGEALRRAAAAGVRVAAHTCRLTPETLEIDREIPVVL